MTTPVSTYLNVRDHLGRVTGRRAVSAEVIKANARTAWVDIGGSVIKRKLRRDFSRDDQLRIEDARAAGADGWPSSVIPGGS